MSAQLETEQVADNEQYIIVQFEIAQLQQALLGKTSPFYFFSYICTMDFGKHQLKECIFEGLFKRNTFSNQTIDLQS